MQDIQLSAVILSYNSLHLLENCIASIYRFNDIGSALEIILVDNASANQHDIEIFIQNKFPEVRIILNENNAGYGAGNNIGIKNAKGQIVMLVNPDVLLHEPIFQHILAYFQKHQTQALLGIQQKDQYLKTVNSFLMRRLSIQNFWINWIYEKLGRFDSRYSVIVGACFFMNKDIFIKAGGYDENIFLYGEERLLHERILHNFPAARISIDFSKSFIHHISNRQFDMRIVKYGLASYFYLQKFLGKEKQKTYAEVISYYRFLVLFYTVKNKRKVAQNYKAVIDLLKNDFEKVNLKP